MVRITDEHREVVDAFAHLYGDIIAAADDPAFQHLRALIAAALRAQLEFEPSLQALPPGGPRWTEAAPDSVRVRLIEDVEALDARAQQADETPVAALLVHRRDSREVMQSDALVDSLAGLVPSERLGPFATVGGTAVWFDIFAAASRVEVRTTGTTTPALVLTQAQPPVIGGGATRVDIDQGTVWIRGDLVDGALPANAFVGIKVDSGSLELAAAAIVSGSNLEVAPPLTGVLRLRPAPDRATLVACASADTDLTLPASLTFEFGAATATPTATDGKARAWGQQFDFGPSTGGWTFIPSLSVVVLGYDSPPQDFDAATVTSELVKFDGKHAIGRAGLGLPVVVASNPAILGEAALAASWLLQVKRMAARWYEPDARQHELEQVWVAISGFGATIIGDAVAPLAPAVTHVVELWAIAGPSGKRLPWRQTYATPFLMFYRCHVVDGEHFLVRGSSDVALDRPVTTDGAPVPLQPGKGTLLLHRLDGKVTALLGAVLPADPASHQFALRNALVWTRTPTLVIVQGELDPAAPARVDAGVAQIGFAVEGWAPTLPDPYVANAFIFRPGRAAAGPQGQLLVRITWTEPTKLELAFEGQLGPRLALGGRAPSDGEPKPAPDWGGDPNVGLTLVEQERRTRNRQQEAEWRQAQLSEQRGRGERLEHAQQENKKSTAIIDHFMNEAAGPASGLLLLDVSTNQDLLGVAFGGQHRRDPDHRDGIIIANGALEVRELTVRSPVANMRVVALPQVQWEPVRTLDADQDIMTMGWFPTPLAAASDGGTTQIGARYQKLMPIIPQDALQGTFDAYRDGTAVGVRTTFPFGLVAAIRLQPHDTATRKADLYALTRPTFPGQNALGGIQVSAYAEGGRPDNGGISATFEGALRQWLNGVDLATGAPLGISVIGSTGDPLGSVEAVFNNDMSARPRVPVTRIDLSGYGGSNFSDWNNPFAAFAEAAKVQFRYMIGRTALEVIKVNTVWHPWGVRLTRSVTIERRPGGGVIRRDSGWQAFTPGIFDYRYADTAGNIVVAPYVFDAGVFRGLFNVRNIRPAPGAPFVHGTAQLLPYYADAEVALEGMPGRTAGIGILGYLQTAPSGVPAGADALQALLLAQGPVGGPVDCWFDFGGSGLPFRARRVEVGLAMSGADPLFVATVRGVPALPRTGAWSVVTRPVASVPPNGGEAVPVAENRGVPVIRRYPVLFAAGDSTVYTEPRLDPGAGAPGDYRFADAADLLTAATPANDYALLQSTATHAFLFPRPFVPAAGAPRLESGYKPALADIFARATSKGAFPPPANTIELAPGAHQFQVVAGGALALAPGVVIHGYPTPLRLAGASGHGSSLFYDTATIRLELQAGRWEAEFSGLRVWSDISGLERISGSEMRIVGSTEQRPQIAEIKTLVLQELEELLAYIPLFGARGTQGPVDLGASNAKHEFKVDVTVKVDVPPAFVVALFPAGSGVKLTLSVKQSTGIDIATGGAKASAIFGVELEGKVPLLSLGVAAVFLVVAGKITFSLVSVSGSVTSEKLELMAFVGVGVEGKIGPFKAYAFLGVGFVLVYDAIAAKTKYGGLVALEAGVDLVIVQVKIRAQLKGLVYQDAGATKCDYEGSVKIQVDIFLIFSISASYQVTETTTF